MRRLLLLSALFAANCSLDLTRSLEPGELRGSVVELLASGMTSPVANARIRLSGAGLAATSGTDGRFVLRGLPPGTYDLRIDHDSNGDGTIDAGLLLTNVLLEHARDLGRVTIGALGAVDGQVLRGGVPVEGARVTIPLVGHAITGTDGAYAMPRVPPGDWILSADIPVPGGLELRRGANVTVVARETASADLEVEGLALGAVGSVSGRVRLGGADSHAGVVIHLLGRGAPVRLEATNVDGLYTGVTIPAGIYTVAATTDGYLTTALADVIIDGDTTLPDLVLLPASCVTDGTCDLDPGDDDTDGITNGIDNCRFTPNAGQQDVDGSGIGDACEEAPVSGCPCEFVESFDDTTRVDTALTTATVTGGAITVPAAFTIESPGTGATTPFTATTSGTIEPGTLTVSSFDVTGELDLTVAGDLVLNVQGPFRMHGVGTGAAVLRVNGHLTLRVSGPFEMDCAYLDTDGSLTIEHSGTEGILATCATGGTGVYFESGLGGGGGGVSIRTRGPFLLRDDGYIIVDDPDPGVASGDLVVHAGGDVTIGPADSYYIIGDSDTRYGNLTILSEGKVRLETDSWLISGRQAPGTATGGDITVRAKGGFEMKDGGNLGPHATGHVGVFTEGDFILDDAIATGAQSFTIAARNVILRNDAYIGVYAATGGAVDVSAGEDVLLDNGSISSGSPTPCLDAGDVRVRAEGNIELRNFGGIIGGRGNVDCPGVHGGDVTVEAGGTITVQLGPTDTEENYLRGGTGPIPGTLTKTPGAPLVLAPVFAGLTPTLQLTSTALPLAANGTVVLAEPLDTTPPDVTVAFPLVAADGDLASLRGLPHAVGKPIAAGWKYRLLIEPRLFEAATVGGFKLRAE